MVVMLALIFVVPVVAFWINEAAVIAPPSVVVPLEFTSSAPNAPLLAPPTTPLKVTLPAPDWMIKPLAAEAVLPTLAALLSVELKLMAPLALLLLEFSVRAALRATGPV